MSRNTQAIVVPPGQGEGGSFGGLGVQFKIDGTRTGGHLDHNQRPFGPKTSLCDLPATALRRTQNGHIRRDSADHRWSSPPASNSFICSDCCPRVTQGARPYHARAS